MLASCPSVVLRTGTSKGAALDESRRRLCVALKQQLTAELTWRREQWLGPMLNTTPPAVGRDAAMALRETIADAVPGWPLAQQSHATPPTKHTSCMCPGSRVAEVETNGATRVGT